MNCQQEAPGIEVTQVKVRQGASTLECGLDLATRLQQVEFGKGGCLNVTTEEAGRCHPNQWPRAAPGVGPVEGMDPAGLG